MPQKTFPHLKHNFNFIDEVEKVVTSRLGIGTQLTHCGDDVDGQNGDGDVGDGHDGYMAMMVMVMIVMVMMVMVMMVIWL